MLNGALEVVWRVLGFGRQRPWGFVARADIDSAEEDGMKLYFNTILLQQGPDFAKVSDGEVAVR